MPENSVTNLLDSAVRIGYFGKIPARGDFVRAGLSREATRIWDQWIQHVLPVAEAQIGDNWATAWSVAPVWRFSLPAGHLGPHCMVGLWLPSIDSTGRQFPFMIAAEGVIHDNTFLEWAEQVGRDTIAFDITPKAILHQLHVTAAPDNPAESQQVNGRWWTEGGPYVRPYAFEQEDLPNAATFKEMLYS